MIDIQQVIAGKVSLSHEGERTEHGGILVEKLLAELSATQFTVGFAIYGPHTQTGEHPVTHSGAEFLIVLDGSMIAEVEGQSYPLSSGDMICFQSTKPHRGWNPNDVTAKALFVNFQPG